ncbi:MAG: DUF2283 domain-containing protein [Chloroflexota bacterium]|nr:DUF2283 domain-containing protein [Chloroflexota bacterium]
MAVDPVVYDAQADTLYVRLTDQPVGSTTPLDDLRILDHDADGTLVGVEFIDVSRGIDLHDLPFGPDIEKLIASSGHSFKIVA